MAVSAYERAKELELERKERAERKEQNKDKVFVDHFVSVGADETVRLRFLYNLLDEPNHEREMVCFLMHDYYIQADRRFVRALCAKEENKACHWCQIAESELKKAQDMKGGDAKKQALLAAHRKEAREHFVLPCFVLEVDEEGKPIAVPKLLDLKPTVLKDLMVKFDNGIEDEDENGKEIRVHDITIGDFELTRTGSGTDTRYTIQFTRVKRKKLPTVSQSSIRAKVLESRPIQEPKGVEATKSADNTSTEWDTDDHPF